MKVCSEYSIILRQDLNKSVILQILNIFISCRFHFIQTDEKSGNISDWYILLDIWMSKQNKIISEPWMCDLFFFSPLLDLLGFQIQLHYFLHKLRKNSPTQTLEKQHKMQIYPGFSYQGKNEQNYWFMPSILTFAEHQLFPCSINVICCRAFISTLINLSNGNMYTLGGQTIIFCKWQCVKYFLIKIFKSKKL